MALHPIPYLIDLTKLGAPDIGYISVVEAWPGTVPFEVKRVFWTYYTPESILRGRHAHHRTEQIIIAVAGRITVTTEQADGTIQIVRLETPHVGLYVPPHTWHTMQYSHSAVQLVLASQPYDAADYIRDYDQFREVWRSQPQS